MTRHHGSIVTLQFGQCGNQLGLHLFENLAAYEYPDASSRNVFFSSSNSGQSMQARSVLVDMEPKVVAGCLRKRKQGWGYSPASAYTGEGGSGNNWAAGFNEHGPRVREVVMELIRRQVEKTDVLCGFLAIHSLAGGTGSGIGTYFTEQIRDEFRPPAMVNSVVWPHSAGEVAVQSYNAMFTLSHLLETSNAIISLQNDAADRICSKYLHIERPTLAQLNTVLSQDLATALLPSLPVGFSTNKFIDRNVLLALSTQLCPHPGYTIVEATTFPQLPASSLEFDTFNWKSVLRDIERAASSRLNISPRARAGNSSSASNMLFLRGLDVDSATSLLSGHVPTSSAARSPSQTSEQIWNLTKLGDLHIRLGETKRASSLCGYDKRATLLRNSRSISPHLRRVVDKSSSKYRSGAYVHQYTKFGIGKESFVEALVEMNQVVDNYRQL